MLVHLIRHATHDEVGRRLSGRSEIALNAAGRVEAARLAADTAARPIGSVHSSPRTRARETAAAIAAPRGLAVQVTDALDEIDFGGWTGAAFAALEGDPAWTRWNTDRAAACPPGGETMAAATARAVGYVATVAEAEGEPAALVSHADVIRGVIAHYLGLPPSRMLAFDIDPASLSTLSVGAWGGRVVSLNARAA